jgi:hypothetical protein
MKVPDRGGLFHGLDLRHAHGDHLGDRVVDERNEGEFLLGTERDDEAIEGRKGRVRVGVVEQGAQLGAIDLRDLGERGDGGDVLADEDLLDPLDDLDGLIGRDALEARARQLDELEVEPQRRVRVGPLEHLAHVRGAVLRALRQFLLRPVRVGQPRFQCSNPPTSTHHRMVTPGMQRSTPVGPGDPTLLAREGARRPTPSIARADLLRCPALPSCWARHRAVARGRANRTVPRASAAGAVGRGAGCCPRSRRADSSGRAVARAELLGAARRLSDAEASGQQRSSCARGVGRRHPGGCRLLPEVKPIGHCVELFANAGAAELLGAASGCCPRSTRSDTAPAADARGCVWGRPRRAVGRDAGCCPRSRRADNSGRAVLAVTGGRLLPGVKPIGRCVELFAALARRRAVGRGIGLLPEVDPIGQRGAVGRGAGRWRARLRVGSGAELLGAGPAVVVVRYRGDRTEGRARRPAVARSRAVLAGVTLGESAVARAARGQPDRTVRRAAVAQGAWGAAPSCWVRRRLLSDAEAIGQQVGRDVRLLPAVEPCWPPSPWGRRLLPEVKPIGQCAGH